MQQTSKRRARAIKRAKALTTNEVRDFILYPGHRYPLSYLLGELAELWTEIWAMNRAGIRDERQDVIYAFLMLFTQWTGISVSTRLCEETVQKFIERRAVWVKIFRLAGAQFSNRHLTGGSNYNRREKVRLALYSAGVDVTLTEADEFMVEAVRRTRVPVEEREAEPVHF